MLRSVSLHVSGLSVLCSSVQWRVSALVLGGVVLAASLRAQAVVPAPSFAHPVAQDVNDFSFDSFDAEYELARDADGRSTLATVETIVARFPDANQNHGIRHAIPTRYEGHPTDIVIDSVTDEIGCRKFATTHRQWR
jgi:hypothetical protein